MTRRKKLARDFRTCQRCGYVGLLWPRKESRQTNKPLDGNQPFYLDMDAAEPDAEGYDCYGYRIRGRRVTDLASWEERAAQYGRNLSGSVEGARRVVKCWPIHACAPERGPGGPSGPPTPAPVGKERGCPD